MKLAIDVARFTAWASLTLLFCVLSGLGIGMRAVPAHVNGVLDTYQLDGVLAGKAVNDLRLTLDNVNRGAIEERQYLEHSLPDTAARMNRSLDEADALLASARGAVDVANAQMQHVGPVLDATRDAVTDLNAQAGGVLLDARPVLTEAARTERDLGVAVRDVDAFVTAPELKATLSSVRETSANVAAGSAEATAILRDGRKEADALVAPKRWYKRVWGDALKVGELVWDFSR